jgi:hypothetical protein
MDSAQNSDSFYEAGDDKYLEYSSANRRTLELLGKLLDAAKRAQDKGKNLALNKMFFTEALYLKNKQALAQQAKQFVQVRGVIVD